MFLKGLILLGMFTLLPERVVADTYDDYWNELQKMKYQDQIVEVDGQKYRENSLYKEEGNLFEETTADPKLEEQKDTKEYMSDGSLVPKNYKGILEE